MEEKLDKKEGARYRNAYRTKPKDSGKRFVEKVEARRARYDEVLDMSIQELLVELLLLLENRGANVNIKGGYRGSR